MLTRPNASRILHRDLTRDYPVIRSGEGVTFTDATGKSYIDFSGGAAVSCLGHRHPRVVRAMKEQLDRVEFAHTAYFTSEPAEELADLLIEAAPEEFGRVMFVSGGTEANEAALKLARQIQMARGEGQRDRFVSRRMSYHGTTLGTGSISGNLARRIPFEPILNDNVAFADPCNAYRLAEPGESLEDYGRRAAASIEAAIEEAGSDRVIAVIAETVSGATMGCVPPAPGYFQEVRRICDRHGALLILDEVMCGSGRAGTLYAFEQDGVVPDMVTMAKGLGGGYQPIGAMLVREAWAELLLEAGRNFMHGHTYMAHPMATAAALAVQRVIEDEGLLGRVERMGRFVRERLGETFGEHPHIGDMRGRGLFLAVEIVADRETKEPFPASRQLPARIMTFAMDEGLICYPGGGTADGTNGAHVLLAPPYIISEDDAAEAVARLGRAIDRALAAD